MALILLSTFVLLVALILLVALVFALLWLSQAEMLLTSNSDLLTTLIVQLELELMPSLLEVMQVKNYQVAIIQDSNLTVVDEQLCMLTITAQAPIANLDKHWKLIIALVIVARLQDLTLRLASPIDDCVLVVAEVAVLLDSLDLSELEVVCFLLFTNNIVSLGNCILQLRTSTMFVGSVARTSIQDCILGKIEVYHHIDCKVVDSCNEDEIFVSITILPVSEAVRIYGVNVTPVLLFQTVQLLVLLIEAQLAICQDVISCEKHLMDVF